MKVRWLLIFACLSLSAGEIFQVSTFKALQEGVFEGDYRYLDIIKRGNFGLGTFNGTDGEMIAIDGKFYQDSPTGALKPLSPTKKTPFACVTFFKPTHSVKLKDVKSFKQIGAFLAPFIKDKNTPHAIRIDGKFNVMKLRSLRKQIPPYRPLAIAAKEQYKYEFHNTEGSLVGFYFPSYLDGINVGGFHFHYIDAKREVGGHVLDFSIKSGETFFMPASELTIDFPHTEAFNKANLNEVKE